MSNKLKTIATLAVVALIVVVGSNKFSTYKREKDAFIARSNDIQKARRQVLSALKDPQSVQLRNEKWLPKSETLCGEINAKNSMGGYVGFKKFFATHSDFLLQGAGFRTANLGRFKSASNLQKEHFDYLESNSQQNQFLINDIFENIWNEACSGESESL